MIGYHFTRFDPATQGKSPFEQLLDIFLQLITYTSGDVGEALNWLTQLDKEYGLTNNEYGLGDFIDELKEKGYLEENKVDGSIKITPKASKASANVPSRIFLANSKRASRGITKPINPARATKSTPIPVPTNSAIPSNRSTLPTASETRRSTTASTSSGSRKKTWRSARPTLKHRPRRC